jgi:hypothetical protein
LGAPSVPPTGSDQGTGAAGNATNLLIAGIVERTIDGQGGLGGIDAFLSKRTGSGTLVWTRVVGTGLNDFGNAATFDSAGNAYMAGDTAGSLSGFTNAGETDLYVARYDASGTPTLLKQWGTSASDVAFGIQVDCERQHLYHRLHQRGARRADK